MAVDRTGRRVYSKGDDALFATCALILIALVAATAYAVWAAGQTAALLVTGTWPPVSAGRFMSLLGILITQHGRVRAVWPEDPPWLFWLLLAVLMAAGGTVAAVFARWWLARRPIDGAAWGGRKTELQMVAPDKPAERAGRVVAGRGLCTGNLIAGQSVMSAIIYGAPGVGKTAAIIVPNAMEWVGPLIVTTIKGADLEPILAARPENFWVIAPAGGVPGLKTHRWSPVIYSEDPRKAELMATWLAEASTNFADERSRPWIAQAIPIIKGMLLAANKSGGGIDQWKRWLSQGKRASEQVDAILRQFEYLDVADEYMSPWLDLHADGQGSIIFTLNGIAKVYMDPDVRDTANGMDFTAEQLLDSGGTLALVSPVGDADRYAPLMTAIIASVIHAAQSRYNLTGKPMNPALGVLSDETGNFLRWRGLTGLLTTGRGQGIVVVTAWHDLSQLYSHYGERDGNTIASASKLRVLFPAVGDLVTLKQFEAMLGREHVSRGSVTRGDDGRSTRSSAIQETDLAPAHALQQLPDDEAIVQYANLRPIKVRIRPWHRDKRILSTIRTYKDPDGMVVVLRDGQEPPTPPSGRK